MGQIRDIMEKNVITIENDKTAQEAAEIIAEKDISFLVVINDGIPQGVLSCLLYTSPSPRDGLLSRMPSSA